MRKTLLCLSLICIFLTSCRRSKPSPVDQLPAATQEGKNTLGLLLNGEPWTPKGYNGSANLSIDVDFSIKQGVFNISAYRIISSNDRQYFGIGLKDSLSFTLPTTKYELGNGTLFGAYFSNNRCMLDYFDNGIDRVGELKITRLDRGNRIIAGKFSAKLARPDCETIQITEGRFDMRY